MGLLHYALNANGMLWLGQSETIGAHRDLFEVVDTHFKFFVRKPGARRPLRR